MPGKPATSSDVSALFRLWQDAIRKLRERVPTCGIEVLTPDWQGNWDALKLVMEARPDVLNHNIETVPRLFRRFRPAERADHDLTPHEIRVLKLLVDGHNYKTAAAELGVSVNTISFHTRRIYDKLHVHTKSEAVAAALRNHIVS